jgi:hypothetical protein
LVYEEALVETESGGDQQGGKLSTCFGCLNEIQHILLLHTPVSGGGKGYVKKLYKDQDLDLRRFIAELPCESWAIKIATHVDRCQDRA